MTHRKSISCHSECRYKDLNQDLENHTRQPLLLQGLDVLSLSLTSHCGSSPITVSKPPVASVASNNLATYYLHALDNQRWFD